MKEGKMISKDYSIAISETLEILNHTEKDDVDKIPIKFLEFLQNNASKTYISTLDFSKSLKDMNLNKKTIGILSIIHKKYWCNDEERKLFEEKLKQNEIEYQKLLDERYDVNRLFKNKEVKDIQSLNVTSLIEYTEPKWYKKLFAKILKLLRKI